MGCILRRIDGGINDFVIYIAISLSCSLLITIITAAANVLFYGEGGARERADDAFYDYA